MATALRFINVILLFLLIGIASATPPKSVNLALETSFLFEPHDIKQNSTVLNNVRRFLDKLENILRPKEKPVFRAQDESSFLPPKNGDRLTKFLAELGALVINYEDEDVKSLAKALNDEVTKNYVNNPQFHKIFKDAKLKMFIKNTVKEWTTTDPLWLKVEIAKYITSTENSAFVSFFRNLNGFFETDKSKFKKLLKKFVKAKKTKKFSKPLEKTIQFVYDRYDKMDDKSKNQLDYLLKILTAYVAKKNHHKLAETEDFRRSLTMDNTTALDFSESVRQDFGNSDNSIENVKKFSKEVDKEIQVSIQSNNDFIKKDLTKTTSNITFPAKS